MRGKSHQRAASRRGFTLVELMIVVAMVGVLAALALVGFRKYINSAGSAEALAVMQGIRGGEEAYKAEMLVYRGCSSALDDYYPMATPSRTRYHWVQSSHSDFPCWREINVTTDGPVRFGYAVVSGVAPAITAVPVGFTTPPTFPAVTQPWYVIQAAGDRDEDGVRALFLTSSLQSDIYSENDSE